MLFATLNYHLQQYDTPVSHDIWSNLYVDNVVTGCSSETQALQFCQQARFILLEAKFNLRAWASNSQLLMMNAQIGQPMRASLLMSLECSGTNPLTGYFLP